MPKLKTHKGLLKRIKVTATGKMLHYRPGRRHLMTGKRAANTRQMRRPEAVATGEAKRLRQLIPYV